jgi:hypothetical protein
MVDSRALRAALGGKEKGEERNSYLEFAATH